MRVILFRDSFLRVEISDRFNHTRSGMTQAIARAKPEAFPDLCGSAVGAPNKEDAKDFDHNWFSSCGGGIALALAGENSVWSAAG